MHQSNENPVDGHQLYDSLSDISSLAYPRALRDLIWILASPNLLSDTSWNNPGHIDLGKEMMRRLQTRESVQALDTMLANKKSHFLGTYFESLWHFYLMQNPAFEVVAHNLQIHSKGKTLGEFDFIIYDHKRGYHVHQELAIKFYMGYQIQDQSFWVGPQSVDRLDLKMNHFKAKQLKLGQNPVARAKLKELGVEQLETEVLMKGILFYPMNDAGCAVPDEVNRSHAKGEWLHFGAAQALLNHPHYQEGFWHILETKQVWLAPQPFENTRHLLDTFDLLDRIKTDHSFRQRPQHLSFLQKENGAFRPRRRLFLLPDDWPRISKTPPAL